MSTHSAPSSLLSLPPELRDLIYHHTFTTPFARPLQPPTCHPLTCASRQLRAETLPLFLHLTRFNAHLDDQPPTPLANWLVALGAERCLLLREVNIWDLHMLNGVLCGVEETRGMMRRGTRGVDGVGGETGRRQYVLRTVGRDIFHGSWYLREIVLALQTIGLGLRRFCEVLPGDAERVKQTSHFAIVRAGDLERQEGDLGLVGQFGLHEDEQRELVRQLDDGKRLIQLQEGRRKIFLAFHDDRRLVDMRQQFIPRDEEFYM